MPFKYDKRQLKTGGRFSAQKPRSSTEPASSAQLNSSNSLSSFESQRKEKNLALLDQAERDWWSLAEFRKSAQRCEQYADGNQWSDLINDPDKPGKVITESEYIKRQGKVPLIQNKIYSIVRNIMGQYRSSDDKAIVLVTNEAQTDMEQVLTDILQSVATANQLERLDAVNFNEFLYSGLIAQRISYQYLKKYDRSDAYIENIGYNRIFFNTDAKDPRLEDINRIGVIHDLSLDELLSQFCFTEADKQWMTNQFNARTAINTNSDGMTGKSEKRVNFRTSYDNTRMRVFECWYLEMPWKTYIIDAATGSEGVTDLTPKEIDAANNKRIQEVTEWNAAHPEDILPEDQIALIEYQRKIEPEWQVKYLLDDGTCLLESPNPFAHQEHPFALCAWPMTSGNIYGLVKQIIDQQRMFNRIIMLWDFIIGAGAKGVLLIPEECLGDKTLEEFNEEWVKFNGVLVVKSSKSGAMPTQITANAVPAGIFEMMNIVSGLFQDISGVHGAIQGKTPSSGTSGTLYQQETANASINTLDIMKTISYFKEVRDRKILKIACQFYNGKRRLVSANGEERITIDPEKIRDIDFDLRIIPNTNTPAYRQLVEDRLSQMVMSGMIPPEVYLQNSSDPTSKKVYDSMMKMQEEMQNDPAQQQQMAQATQNNPQAIQLLQKAVGGEGAGAAPPMAPGRNPIPPEQLQHNR